MIFTYLRVNVDGVVSSRVSFKEAIIPIKLSESKLIEHHVLQDYRKGLKRIRERVKNV